MPAQHFQVAAVWPMSAPAFELSAVFDFITPRKLALDPVSHLCKGCRPFGYLDNTVVYVGI